MASKGQQNPKTKRLRNDSLVESLRDLGSGVTKSFTEDLLGEIPKDIFNQTGLRPQRTSGTTNPNPWESGFGEAQRKFEQKLRQVEVVRREEKLLFTAKEQETKSQIAVLIAEVQKLAGAVQNLDKEVKVAAMQAPVEPGTYHVSFFEKLISFLKSLTQKIENASVWLSTQNTKTKRQPFYWAQVRKSGSKFMLSQERYMSTQAG